LSPDSTEVFERDVGDRRRLELQFGLLREDFNFWFDQTLRLGGLSTDPGRADWSVLDVGCGEGLFTREIARRYPKARAVGIDVAADAVAAASARSAADPNVRFLVHDATAAGDPGHRVRGGDEPDDEHRVEPLRRAHELAVGGERGHGVFEAGVAFHRGQQVENAFWRAWAAAR